MSSSRNFPSHATTLFLLGCAALALPVQAQPAASAPATGRAAVLAKPAGVNLSAPRQGAAGARGAVSDARSDEGYPGGIEDPKDKEGANRFGGNKPPKTEAGTVLQRGVDPNAAEATYGGKSPNTEKSGIGSKSPGGMKPRTTRPLVEKDVNRLPQ